MQTINNTKSNQRGFTIIEVVLVLAIAGLIFLMVFLALPALQRSQRDSDRKNSASRMMAQLTNYQSNNQGAIPANTSAAWTTFRDNYLTNNSQTFNDPSTNASYTMSYVAAVATAPSSSLGTVSIYSTARCNANAQVAGTSGGQVAVMIPIEQGGFYCLQN